MVYPNLGGAVDYTPRWGGAHEINIGDQWRARWNDEQALPKGAPVVYAYAVVCLDSKGYVTRKAGSTTWGTIEGDLRPGESPEAFVKRAAKEQVGARSGRLELIGFLECKATSHNVDYPRDAITLRPIYLFAPKQLGDVPDGSGYERRRLPMNEFVVALRSRYPELDQYLVKATERYAVLKARAEV